MLEKRLLTIAVILPLFIAALFLLSHDWFAVVLLLALAIGLQEWATLSAIDSLLKQAVYVTAGLLVAWATIQLMPHGRASQLYFFVAALLWVVISIWLSRYNRGAKADVEQAGNGSLSWLFGYFVLIPAVFGLYLLKAEDSAAPQLLLVFFLIIWSADSGAYLVGRKWGKTKLAPGISPGKTVEGVYGGLLGALVVALVAGIVVWSFSFVDLVFWLLAVILVTLFSVTGDLYESVYKRRAGVKDSGNLLPGHGGVLDRIDSSCAAIPFYISALYLLGILKNGSMLA